MDLHLPEHKYEVADLQSDSEQAGTKGPGVHIGEGFTSYEQLRQP